MGVMTSGSEQVSHILYRRDVFDESTMAALAPASIAAAAVVAQVV
jgi:hypothetical protein